MKMFLRSLPLLPLFRKTRICFLKSAYASWRNALQSHQWHLFDLWLKDLFSIRMVDGDEWVAETVVNSACTSRHNNLCPQQRCLSELLMQIAWVAETTSFTATSMGATSSGAALLPTPRRVPNPEPNTLDPQP